MEKDLIGRAYDFAQKAHEGQTRAEGTPYFTHCLEVVKILHMEWGITDEAMLAAGHLHDTIEDSEDGGITPETIWTNFGERVASLVEGVTQLRSEKDSETLRRLTNENLIDPRIIVIKLADRLHNMRTLSFVHKDKQIDKAKETVNAYVPMAESLGIWEVKSQLEDLSLKYLSPKDYADFSDKLKHDKRTDEEGIFTGFMKSSLELLTKETGVKASIEIRVNSLARLRHKMERTSDFASINDVVSFRVIVDDTQGKDRARDDCYKVLGRVSEIFGPFEDTERFDNFFSRPKDNGYSAIQITLTYPFGAVEIAITSASKEEFNKWGVVSLIRRGEKDLSDYVLKLIFTPTGQVKFFPKEATGIDLAYSIDPVMGIRATGVLIDNREYPISAVLPNGAEVKVLFGKPRVSPPEDYLYFALPQTRKLIEKQIENRVRQEYIVKGKEIAAKIVSKTGYKTLEEVLAQEEHVDKLMQMLFIRGFKGHLNNLYFQLGSGKKDEAYLEEFLKSVTS